MKKSGDYRLLKNRMKNEFRALRASIEDGALPPPALLHSFLNNSKTMTNHAGEEYGEADYPAYLESCAALGKACAAGDLEAASEALARVSAIRTGCHGKWKT